MGNAWPRKIYVGVAGGNFCFCSGWPGVVVGGLELNDMIKYRDWKDYS